VSVDHLEPLFVETVPEDLDEGVLYVSMEFRTTIHLCACGCGQQVTLPLRRSAWSLTYNGEAITMRPSVGNWSFPCQSHYWIRDGHINWAGRWTPTQIEQGRQRTLAERRPTDNHEVVDPSPAGRRRGSRGWVRLARRTIRDWFRKR
jgi:hypothetical protein